MNNKKSELDKKVICFYNDYFNNIDDCDTQIIKKLLNIYFNIHLGHIKIEDVIIKTSYECKNDQDDLIKIGTKWLLNENNNLQNKLTNNIFIYIGIGYIKIFEKCLLILWCDNISKKQCYYTINKSQIMLLKDMSTNEKLEVTSMLNNCFGELLSKKKVLKYKNF